MCGEGHFFKCCTRLDAPLQPTLFLPSLSPQVSTEENHDLAHFMTGIVFKPQARTNRELISILVTEVTRFVAVRKTKQKKKL